jgi:hypothetical protein
VRIICRDGLFPILCKNGQLYIDRRYLRVPDSIKTLVEAAVLPPANVNVPRPKGLGSSAVTALHVN